MVMVRLLELLVLFFLLFLVIVMMAVIVLEVVGRARAGARHYVDVVLLVLLSCVIGGGVRDAHPTKARGARSHVGAFFVDLINRST